MENSHIGWTDHTANLWHGCMEVHEGCDNCYAKALNNRYHHENPHWGGKVPRLIIKKTFNDLAKFQKKAAGLGVIHRVFVGSMMDIFEKPMPLVDGLGVPVVYANDKSVIVDTGFLRNKLFDNISSGMYPNILFLLLTKRPSNINKYIPAAWQQNGAPKNVIFGASVVNQPTADRLIPELLQVNGRLFLSMEPILGSVRINYIEAPDNDDVGASRLWPFEGRRTDMARPCPDTPGKIEWVICGGESGHNARPMNPDWARSLRDQCQKAKVPFFFKQWGKWVSELNSPIKDPLLKLKHSDDFVTKTEDGLDYTGEYMIDVSNYDIGSLLDGVDYKEFPLNY